MSNIHSEDLAQMAGALTAFYGAVPTSALVSMGRTCVVRPGAITQDGVLLTGQRVAAALGDDFEVFPLAVEYAVDTDGFDEALGALDDALDDADSLGEDEQDDDFGALFKRDLRKRYLRIVGRYRKVMSKLQARSTKGRQRRADRRFRRMLKVWQKMKRKGVDASGLPNPVQVRREFVERTPAYEPPPVVVQTFEPAYAPVARGPSAAYLQDQAALEREMQASMPRYFGAEAEEDLDIALGALDVALSDLEDSIGAAEDDEEQFGLFKVNLPKRYLRVVARYRKVMTKVEEKPTRGRRRRANRRFRRMTKLWQKMDRKGIDTSDLPSPASVRREFREVIEEAARPEVPILRARRRAVASYPTYLIPSYAAAQEALESDARVEALGYAMSSIEHDYYGMRGSDVEVLYSDPDIVGEDDDMDDELGDDVDDEEVLGASDGDEDEEIGLLRLPGWRMRAMKRWLRRGGYLTSRRARRVSRWRTRWMARLARLEARGKRSRKQDKLRARIALANELLSKSSALYGANDGGGIDYGRLQPKTPGTGGPAVVVIAIRKRATDAQAQQQAVSGYAGSRGLAPANEPRLLDVMAADLAIDGYRVNTGYNAPVAMDAIASYTHPSNWMHGIPYGSLAAFPQGEAPPFPPPRRTGAEVQ